MLHLGEVEKGSEPGTLGAAEGFIVVEEVEAKVHKAASERLTINKNMSLGQMPASGAHKELGGLVIELVNSVSGLVLEAYGPINSISQINLASH